MSRTRLRRGDRRAIWAACILPWTIPLAALLSTQARADGPSVEQYTAANGPRVCAVLDAFPDFNGIGGIADALVQQNGFSYYQAGEIEALSVITFCPRHLTLIRAYAGLPAQPTVDAHMGGAIGGPFRA